MARCKDLLGKAFGLLTVSHDAGYRDGNNYRVWCCRCACGTEVNVSAKNLLRGSATTCGCRSIKRASLSGREYRIWTDMKTRCFNPRSNRYGRYGARGIIVCERWRDNFRAFLSDMGPCPPGMTIDRMDNDGPYSPDNCRWATNVQQLRNYSRNRMLTLNGRTQCMSSWGRELGIDPDRIQARLASGWSTERALLPGPQKRQRKDHAATALPLG